MRFRPCIDIHNGQVKQIVGGSLTDENDFARENFVSEQDAAWYAKLYREDGLKMCIRDRNRIYHYHRAGLPGRR